MNNSLQMIGRISQAKKDVENGLKNNNIAQIQDGVENISLLLGRLLTQTSIKKDSGIMGQCLLLILESQEALKLGTERLSKEDKGLTVDTSIPSQWLSFDGDIREPLNISQSNITNAGNGVFTNTDIERAECIGPTRACVAKTGDFYQDWKSFPLAQMINHHPVPNCTIIRAGAPFATNNVFGETCYLVANRKIEKGEELTTDYRDKGWAEYDYWDHIDLPFEQWDKNALRGLTMGLNSNPRPVLENKQAIMQSASLLGGSGLFYASTLTKGLPSHLLALCGIAFAGYGLYEKVK